MNTTNSQRCASCPTQLKSGDTRFKIGRYTYCQACRDTKITAIEVPNK